MTNRLGWDLSRNNPILGLDLQNLRPIPTGATENRTGRELR
jgi:hypothetical protein